MQNAKKGNQVVEKASEQVNHEYLGAVKDYRAFAASALAASINLQNINGGERRYWASVLFLRIVLIGRSISKLCPEIKEGHRSLWWEFASVATLLRLLFESFLFFSYFIERCTDDEWLAKLNLMQLNDCTSRIRLAVAHQRFEGLLPQSAWYTSVGLFTSGLYCVPRFDEPLSSDMLSVPRRGQCGERSEIWPTLEKSYLIFSRNLFAFRSASTLCEIASRTRSLASLAMSAQQLLRWLRRSSSRSLLAEWPLDLGLQRNLMHKERSGTSAILKQRPSSAWVWAH